MRSENEQHEQTDRDSLRELRMLTELASSSDITQRKLSQRVGIALGLTNTLVRNFVSKGYIRSQKASWKRWAYALTPEGMTHKIKLTVLYVRRVMNDYQTVRQILGEQLEHLSLHEESRVAIIGTGEFAELVFLGLKEIRIEEIDVFSTNPGATNRFLGIPVQDISTINPQDYDRVLVASLNPQSDEEFSKILGESEKLFTFFDISDSAIAPEEQE